MIWQQLANGIAVGSVYALISLGLTMVYGILRILHVAHAGIYTLGAYVGLVAFRLIDNFWLSLVAGMTAIGLFTAMEEAFRIAAGPHTLVYNAKVGLGELTIGGFRLTETQVLILLVTFLILLFLWLFLTRTKMGLAMRACALDTETASTFGVNVNAIIAVNFIIGSFMAGAAGVLIGVYDNQVWPTMGSIPAYKALAIVVLGGLGNIPGTVLASLIVGLAETFFIGVLSVPFPRDAIAFIAMILVLMFRPYGLLGKA